MKTTETITNIIINGMFEDDLICNYDVSLIWSDGEYGRLYIPSFRIPKKYNDSLSKVEKYLHKKEGREFLKRQWNLYEYKNGFVYHLM